MAILTTPPTPRAAPRARLAVLLLAAASFAVACTNAPRALPGPAVVDPPDPVLHAPRDRGYDALHYALDLELDGRRWGFEGTTALRLRAERGLTQVVLDAAALEILGARVDGAPATFEYDGRELVVALPRRLQTGEEAVVEVRYVADRPLAGLHFVLPTLGVYAPAPHVYTQGEALRARHWFPCNDDPGDRATHGLRAEVPVSWTTVAAGTRTDSRTDLRRRTRVETWSSATPLPTYLFHFAAGAFVTVDEVATPVTLRHVVEPEDLDAAADSFAETARVLQVFEAWTGHPFPFPSYGHVAVRDFPFGGMENPGSSTVTRNSLHAGIEQAAHPTWGLVAHEAAHQWFGDLVTCSDWPHIWLNEGFASYLGEVYRRARDGDEAFRWGMGRRVDAYLDACRGDNLRALVKRDYRMPMDLFLDGTVYPGGAARVHLFRAMLGEAVFHDGIRRYLHDNAFRSVPSEALLRAFLDAGAPAAFEADFRQWVEEPGYPVVEIAWRREGEVVTVELTQVQDGAGVPAVFRFPLDVVWYGNGTRYAARLQVAGAHDVLEIPVPGGFDGWLEFDPEAYVPARFLIDEPLEATLACAVNGGSARSRALALRRLDDHGGDAVLAAVEAVAMLDPLAALRGEAVGRFAALVAGEPFGGTMLLDGYDAEPDVAVRRAWWQAATAAGLVPRERLRAVLGDAAAPSAERAAALRALAKDRPVLEVAALAVDWWATPSDGDRVRLAALDLAAAAAARGHAVSAARVRDRASAGVPTPLRVAALGHLLPDLLAADPATVDGVDVDTLFRDALTSPSAVLRRAAAAGAVQVPERFAEELAWLRAGDPDIRLRRILDGAP